MTRNMYQVYDRALNDWTVTERTVPRAEVATGMLHCLERGLFMRGSTQNMQAPDGSVDHDRDVTVVVAWSSVDRENGSRTVLGWYETAL